MPPGHVFVITLLDSGGSTLNTRYLGHALMQRTLAWVHHQTEYKFHPSWIPIIRSAFEKLNPLPKTDPVLKSFRRFHLLNHLPDDSDAHVLGLFSVIEMILTHKPTDNLHDSLRHQVSTKMVLLSRRFLKNDLQSLYPTIDPLALWKALYDWRSLTAHGEESDFSKGSLKKLEAEDRAHAYLNVSVRLLLKTWLDEPELIQDLKRC